MVDLYGLLRKPQSPVESDPWFNITSKIFTFMGRVLPLLLLVLLRRGLQSIIQQRRERSQRGYGGPILALVGSVQGGVEGRLIRIDFKDRPPRVVGAVSVLWADPFAIFIIVFDDLLDVLVGDPVEL